MTCGEIEPLLSDFIDGELAYDVASAMTAHIASCDGCTREYRALRRTVRFVRANGSTQMTAGTPGGVYEEFHRAILDETATLSPTEAIAMGFVPRDAVRQEGTAS